MLPVLSDSNREQVWISKLHLLPDVCCTCGMFTDSRVRVKHIEYDSVPGATDGGVVLLHIVAFFLGPIGWLLTAIMHDENSKENKTKTVKLKSRIKISQCRLCQAAGAPEILETRHARRQFSFAVHPKFASRFRDLNQPKLDGPDPPDPLGNPSLNHSRKSPLR